MGLGAGLRWRIEIDEGLGYESVLEKVRGLQEGGLHFRCDGWGEEKNEGEREGWESKSNRDGVRYRVGWTR